MHNVQFLSVCNMSDDGWLWRMGLLYVMMAGCGGWVYCSFRCPCIVLEKDMESSLIEERLTHHNHGFAC